MSLRRLQRHPVRPGPAHGRRRRRGASGETVAPEAEEALLLLQAADEAEPKRIEQARRDANNRGRAVPVSAMRKARGLLERAGWRGVELPAVMGEALHGALAKGAGHKYLRRVPTGDAKRPWRYIYGITGVTGHHGQDDGHFDQGAKFRIAHAGKAGHFEVVARAGDRVTVRHDETGHQAVVTVLALRGMLQREHAELVDAHRAKLERDIAMARMHGTAAQVRRLLDEAHRHGHTDLDASRSPLEGAKPGAVVTVRGQAWQRGKGDLWYREDRKRSVPTATLKRWWVAEQGSPTQAEAPEPANTPEPAERLSDAEQRQREEAARRSAERRRVAPTMETPTPTSPESPVHTEVGDHVGGSRADVAVPLGAQADGAASANDVHRLTKADLLTKPHASAAQAAGRSPGAHHLHKVLVRMVGKGPHAGRSRRWKTLADARRRQLSALGKSPEGAFRDGCVYLDKAMARCRSHTDVLRLVAELRELRESVVEDTEAHPVTKRGTFGLFGSPAQARARAAVAERLGRPVADIESVGLRYTYDEAAMAAWRATPGDDRPKPIGVHFTFRDRVRGDHYSSLFDALGEQFSNLTRGKTTDGFRKAVGEAKALDEKGWAQASEDAKREGAARRFRWTDVRGEEYDRVGGQRVAGADGHQMAADFGLKNIQYGKWMSQADREHHLKAAHGALFDLADVLGVEPGQLSLSGRLALAFGGRGQGRAAAHYESDLKIINLTKFAGGGSLAHEWGHFLDNVLAEAHGAAGGFASEGQGHLPEGVVRALDGLRGAMFGEAGARRVALERLLAEHNGLVAAHNGGAANHAVAIKRLRRQIHWARLRVESAETSQFARDAEALGAKYWGSTREMFARAFEAYAHDRLAASGRKNSYLVHGVDQEHQTMVSARRAPTVIQAERKAARERAEGHPEVQAARAAYEAAAERRTAAHEQAYERAMGAHKAKHGRRKPAQHKLAAAISRDADYQRAAQAVNEASRAHQAALAQHTDAVREHHDGGEHPSQAQPYPQGAERAAIGRAFDTLITALRETGALKKAVAYAHDLLKAAAHPLGPAPTRNRQTHPFEGTVRWPGLPLIRVENAVGSVREGVGPEGPWRTEMQAHYGEFAGTEGADGDPIDVFVGPNRHAPFAYVVHQQRPDTGEYDEDKVMLGFDTRADAEAMFRAHYNRTGFVQSVRRLSLPELADWLAAHGKAGVPIDGGRELS